MLFFDFDNPKNNEKNKERVIKFLLESKNIDYKKELFDLFDDKVGGDDLVNKIITFGQLGNIEIKKDKNSSGLYCTIEGLIDCWDGPIDIKKPIGYGATIFETISDFYTILQQGGDFVVQEKNGYSNVGFENKGEYRIYFKKDKRLYNDYVYNQLSKNQDQRNILLQLDIIKSGLLNYNGLSFGQKTDDNKLYLTGSYMYIDENGDNEIIIYGDNFDETFEAFLDVVKSEKGFYYLNHKTKYYIRWDASNNKFVEKKL